MMNSWDVRDAQRLPLGEARRLIQQTARQWPSWVPALPPEKVYGAHADDFVAGGFFPRADGLEPERMPELPAYGRFAYPRCEGPHLEFRVCQPSEAVPHPHLKILESPKSARLVEPEVLFVPALAVDRKGHRIGRGAGFYDRYLARRRPRLTIALVREDLVFDEFPATWLHSGDQRVDACLTESQFLDFKQRTLK